MKNTVKSLATALLNAPLMLILLILIFAFLVLGRVNAITDEAQKMVAHTVQPLMDRTDQLQTTLTQLNSTQTSTVNSCEKLEILQTELSNMQTSITAIQSVSASAVISEVKKSLALWLTES